VIPGRIHSAIVSGVNLETRSVTVEWYERGETKGKEVEIDAILALNPELAVGPRHHTPHLQPMPNKLARVSLHITYVVLVLLHPFRPDQL
jgi:kinesin family member 2/24